MLRTPTLLAALLVVGLTACAAGPVAPPGEEESGGTVGISRGPVGTSAPEDDPTPEVEDEESSFGPADPAFSAHFTHPLYADQAGEFAPFGTDEGWDLLATWDERREDLTDCSTVGQLIAEDVGELEDVADGGPDVDAAVIGAGFGLIYLTGRIDREGRQLTLEALRRTEASYPGVPELTRMIRDLASFPARDTCPR